MKPLPCLAVLLLLAQAARAGSSANYTLAPDAIDSGGLPGTSANYAVNFSNMAGGAGFSAAYTLRTGFAGQLQDAVATAIDLAATPATLNEGGTRQLSATLIFDDQTTSLLDATSVTWSVQSGPLTGISSSGVVTAGSVYQNTVAVAHGTYQTFTDTLDLTVLNTLPDNFGTYAGDGIEDSWQVQYFGLNNPLAGPLLDTDGDGYDNLFEFRACLDPTDAASVFHWRMEPDPGDPLRRRVIFSPRMPGCTYTIKASTNLESDSWIDLVGGIISDNGTERTVTDPDTSSLRKFYKVDVSRP